MGIRPSRSKGFASLDAMASLIPIVMVLMICWQASYRFSESAKGGMERQELFGKLVSVADYTVKSGAVVREGGLRYPNWIDGSLLTSGYAEGLRKEAGLEGLDISLGEPGEGEVCIYRLVVVGEDKAIERLFVCGG
ncbi:MAG: hypothetical protein AB1295_00015 [Candidatus Micrarchaeota archaeon]